MRLLNIKTFQLETFYSDVPEYAALSHTWGDEEVTFQDVVAERGRDKKGWNKILESSIQAAKHGCNYAWIDTCCIDKTSSAELSEAINSMFRWYRKSKVCFAYLEDVSAEPGWKEDQDQIALRDDDETPPPHPRPAICFLPYSRWFKRGWTLQELIAPRHVYFYDCLWNEIGEKKQLAEVIFRTTGIGCDVLCDYTALYTKSIARRMSWASGRETTRAEDVAYCLMGIFNVNMPLLYGEGEKAFFRLQQAILESSYDQSLFAWNYDFPNTVYGSIAENGRSPVVGVGLLAPHPVAFKRSAKIIPHTTKTEPYAITNMGLRICLRILQHNRPTEYHTHFAILQCGYENKLGTAIAIPVAQMPASKASGSKSNFYRSVSQGFIEVEYSEAISLENKNVYLVTAGRLFFSQGTEAFHRCWLRDYGHELGIRFHQGRYCKYPIKTMDSGGDAWLWNYENDSMRWAKSWPGSRAAIYFSTMNGPAFVVILTFVCLSDQGGQIGMDIQTRSVLDRTKEKLSQILVEDLNYEEGFRVGEAQTTLLFEDRQLNIRVKKEIVFDEDIFIIDFWFPGVKRGNPETASESGQKRSKQDICTKREVN